MPRGRHVTLPARAFVGAAAAPAPPRAFSPGAAALRAQIAAAGRHLRGEVEGRDGRPCAPQEAVRGLLDWAGADEDKLRRALRRVLELAAPAPLLERATAASPGDRVAAPMAPRRWRPKASAFDPDPAPAKRRR